MPEIHKYEQKFKKQLGTSLAVERYSVNIHRQTMILDLSGSLNMNLHANNSMAYKRKFWKKILVPTCLILWQLPNLKILICKIIYWD